MQVEVAVAVRPQLLVGDQKHLVDRLAQPVQRYDDVLAELAAARCSDRTGYTVAPAPQVPNRRMVIDVESPLGERLSEALAGLRQPGFRIGSRCSKSESVLMSTSH